MGRVKTRLSPALPPPLACALYRALLDDAIGVLAASRVDERWIYWTDDALDAATAGADAAPIEPPRSVREGRQRGEDLGTRLERAFAERLGSASPAPRGGSTAGSRVVIMGADCPWMDAPYVHRAFDALAYHDVVVGPARDGGYTLIGLRRACPGLFRGVSWGTPRVLDETIARAKGAGLAVDSLEMLEDVDTPEDLVRAATRMAMGAARSSRTRAALVGLGLCPA